MYTPFALANQTVTASGVLGSAFSPGKNTKTAWIVCFVKNAPTGTTPSLTITYEQQDGNGNYITTAQLTAITAIGYVTSQLGAPGIPLTSIARVRATVTGTTPSFTGVDVSVVYV